MAEQFQIPKILLDVASLIAKQTAKEQVNCVEKVMEKFLEVSGALAQKGVIDKQTLLKAWQGLEVEKDLTKYTGRKKSIRIKFEA